MKKILALLLVFIMVFTFAACGGEADPTEPSTPSTPSTPSVPTDDKLEGKTLQVWAMVGPEYESIDKIQANVWLWLVRAAMEDWAAINKVNLQFVSNYDQMSMLAAISSGSKPDFMFAIGKYPEVANLGMVQAFTPEQQEKINAIVGSNWYLSYRGENVGILPPWCGSNLVYYNETLLENYGVKTPKEYIEEDNWTWENYLKICEEITMDVDKDGTIDIYGSTTYAVGGGFSAAFKVDPVTGRVTNNMDSPEVKEWLDILYDAVVNKKILTNQYKHANVAGSGIAMSISDAEPYNFAHLYQTLSNGDVIRAVRRPTRLADDTPGFGCTVYQFAIPRGSDESDAAVDMLCHILKAGLVWLEDHSEGMYETEFEGIVGACEYSAAWLEKYNEFIESRHETFAEIEEEFDKDFYTKMFAQYMAATESRASGGYSGVTSPWQGAGAYSSIFKEPPASSLPKLSAAMEAACEKYNSLYIF